MLNWLYWWRFGAMSWLSALGCAVVFGAVFWLEHGVGLEPCPLCILQRLPMLGILLLSVLGGALAGPLGRWGRGLLAGLCDLLALTGLGLAGRHLWLQQLPPEQVPVCGPGLDVLLEMLPLYEALAVVLAGDGECAEVQWSLFALSIPGWSALTFGGLVLFWLVQLVVGARPKN